MVNQFTKTHPSIIIDFTPLADWDRVVGTVRALERHPHAAAIFVGEVSETLELERSGLITPFQDVLPPARFKRFVAALYPSFLGNSDCRDGTFCGPPFIRSTPIALYNLDWLKKAGIAPSPLPKTWGQMTALLERLRAASGQAPFLFGGDWYDYLFEATVIEAGGSLTGPDGRVTLDGPAAITALAFWRHLMDRRLLARANNWKATINGFAAGLYPVTYYSSGGLETVRRDARFHWTAAMLPKDKIHGVAQGGGNLYVSAHLSPAQRRAAIQFIGFLYRPSVQARISAATGFFPAVTAAFDQKPLLRRYTLDPPFVRARRQLKYAHAKLMAVDNLKVRDILKRAIDRCLDDGVAPATALRQAQTQVNRLLHQNK